MACRLAPTPMPQPVSITPPTNSICRANDPSLLDVSLMLMRETASEFADFAWSRRARTRRRAGRNARSQRFFAAQCVGQRRVHLSRSALSRTVSHRHRRNSECRHLRHAPGVLGARICSRTCNRWWLSAISIRRWSKRKSSKHFAGWQAAPAEPQPAAGPVDAADAGRTEIYVDPALSERVSATRNGQWLDEPDSVAQRQESLLRRIGYDIVNRRLQRLYRQAAPPFSRCRIRYGRRLRIRAFDPADRRYRGWPVAGPA